jgi:Amt family ammonium transporter
MKISEEVNAMKKTIILLLVILYGFSLLSPAFAQEAMSGSMAAVDDMSNGDNRRTAIAENSYAIDNFFVFITGVLVIFMQAGFALVETGLNSAKNSVNILFKNLIDFCIGGLAFFAVGYSMMYPGADFAGGWFGFSGFGISAESPAPGAAVLHPQTSWLFQIAFAATAATIVSGAVAGRINFVSYLIYSAFITGIVYPISGFWQWGGGWLSAMGFHDFAGSLIVHTVGGFAGLAGAIVLGPRIGRYGPNGKAQAMPGHNLALATLGVFVLWVGWYGFNPGSQLAIVGAKNTGAVMLIAVNTTLAACAGGVLGMIMSWILFKKPDLTMALNGVLAGLVGITANCDAVTNGESIIIGAIAGVLVVLGIRLLDKLKIDDPVGAWPVHGLCGLWGGVATGIFGGYSLVTQIVGSLAIALWSFVLCFALFKILNVAGLLRVHAEDEIRGLDITEHGEEGYAGFQIFTTE